MIKTRMLSTLCREVAGLGHENDDWLRVSEFSTWTARWKHATKILINVVINTITEQQKYWTLSSIL